ncbi:MAG: hypothetical protein H6R40_535 [Gemmatimonadetes bacterium]|nr:hypothetical protein [Gemmatimonadota bacterium]
MRTVSLLLLLAISAPSLSSQQKVQRGFPLNRDGSIRIQVPAGRLVVRGWDRDSVSVTGSVPAGGGSFYGGGRGEAAKLGVETDPGGAGPGASLEVQVPHGARLWIKTATPGVELSQVDGEVDVLSVNGAIRMDGNPRVASLESIDGPIDVTAISPILRLRSSDGRVTVRTRGGDLTVVTVGGAVDVAVEMLDRARLESVAGSVAFVGGLGRGAALEAETHGGDIGLRITGEVNADFHLAAPSGTIINQFGPGIRQAKATTVEFAVGLPGASVSARTFKGTIRVGR